MNKQERFPIRAWTPEELEDSKLRNFMVSRRQKFLTLLKVTHTTNPSLLSHSLLEEWKKL